MDDIISLFDGKPYKPPKQPRQPKADEDKIEFYANKNGVDSNFVRALMQQESGGRSNAQSWAGAKGKLQITDDIGRKYAGTNYNPFDDDINLDVGTKHLAYLQNKYGGDLKRVLAAYNAGEGNADKKNWYEASRFWSNDKEVQAGRKPRGDSDKTNTRRYIDNIYSHYERLGGQPLKPIDLFGNNEQTEQPINLFGDDPINLFNNNETQPNDEVTRLENIIAQSQNPERIAKAKAQLANLKKKPTVTNDPPAEQSLDFTKPKEFQITPDSLVNAPKTIETVNSIQQESPNLTNAVQRQEKQKKQNDDKNFQVAKTNADLPKTQGKVVVKPNLTAPVIKDSDGNEYRLSRNQEHLQKGEVRLERGEQSFVQQPDGKLRVERAGVEVRNPNVVEANTDVDKLKGSAGTVEVDFRLKPKGVNAGEWAIRTALETIAPNYNLTAEDIERGMNVLRSKGQFTRTGYLEQFTDDDIADSIKRGVAKAPITINNNLINDILNQRDGRSGLHPELQTELQYRQNLNEQALNREQMVSATRADERQAEQELTDFVRENSLWQRQFKQFLADTASVALRDNTGLSGELLKWSIGGNETDEELEKQVPAQVDNLVKEYGSAEQALRGERFKSSWDYAFAKAPSEMGYGAIVDNLAPILKTGGILTNAFNRYVLNNDTKAKDTFLFKSGEALEKAGERFFGKPGDSFFSQVNKTLGQVFGGLVLTAGFGAVANFGKGTTSLMGLADDATSFAAQSAKPGLFGEKIAPTTEKFLNSPQFAEWVSKTGLTANQAYLGGSLQGVTQAASEAYESAVKAGATENQANLTALIATPAGLFEGLSDRFIVGKLAKLRQADALTNGQFSRQLWNSIKETTSAFVKGGMVEFALEEIPQNLWQKGAARIVYKQSPDLLRDILKDLSDAVVDSLPALLAGGAVSGGVTAAQEFSNLESPFARRGENTIAPEINETAETIQPLPPAEVEVKTLEEATTDEKPEYYETPSVQPIVSVNSDEDLLKTFASTVAVDITKKPPQMNLGEHLLRTALKANQAKYGYSDADIERVIENKRAAGKFTNTKYPDFSDTDFGEVVNQFKRDNDGSSYQNINLPRSIINEALGGDVNNVAEVIKAEKKTVTDEIINKYRPQTEQEARTVTLEELNALGLDNRQISQELQKIRRTYGSLVDYQNIKTKRAIESAEKTSPQSQVEEPNTVSTLTNLDISPDAVARRKMNRVALEPKSITLPSQEKIAPTQAVAPIVTENVKGKSQEDTEIPKPSASEIQSEVLPTPKTESNLSEQKESVTEPPKAKTPLSSEKKEKIKALFKPKVVSNVPQVTESVGNSGKAETSQTTEAQQTELDRLTKRLESKGATIESVKVNDKGVIHIESKRKGSKSVTGTSIDAEGKSGLGLIGGSNYVEDLTPAKTQTPQLQPSDTVQFQGQTYEIEKVNPSGKTVKLKGKKGIVPIDTVKVVDVKDSLTTKLPVIEKPTTYKNRNTVFYTKPKQNLEDYPTDYEREEPYFIAKNGKEYAITSDKNKSGDIKIEVHQFGSRGNPSAQAVFKVEDGVLKAKHEIWSNESRQGLMSAIYDYADKNYGRIIKSDTGQTKQGEAFWSKSPQSKEKNQQWLESESPTAKDQKLEKLSKPTNRKPPSFDSKKHTLSQFVRMMGGIGHSKVIDLAAIRDANEKRKGGQKTGFASMLRNTGTDIEDMFRSAVEAGFFSDKNTMYSPYASDVANQSYDFDVNDFVEAVAADANGTQTFITIDALDEIAGTIEEQEAEYYEEQVKLEEKQNEFLAKESKMMQDKEVISLLAEIEREGKATNEQESELEDKLYEYGLPATFAASIIYELEQSAGIARQNQTSAQTTELLPESEPPIFDAEIDETEPDGEVDLSFDFGEETQPKTPKQVPTNLLGEEIQPKFQDSLFGTSGTDIEADNALTKELTDAYGEKTGKFIKTLTRNSNPNIARVADDLLKARKIVISKGENARLVVERAADALEIFVKAQNGKMSVDEQLTQNNLFSQEFGKEAKEFAQQMESGKFSAEFNNALSEAKSEQPEILRMVSDKNNPFFDDIPDFDIQESKLAQEVDEFFDGKDRKGQPITILNTIPKVFKKLGIEIKPIVITPKILVKIPRDHDLPKAIIKKLPRELADPVMIFDSMSEPDSIVVITNRVDKTGSPIMSAVFINKSGEADASHSIKSVYGRNDIEDFRRWIEKGNLRYINEKKSAVWLRHVGLQLPLPRIKQHSKPTLLTEDDFVKTPLKKLRTDQDLAEQQNLRQLETLEELLPLMESKVTKDGVEVNVQTAEVIRRIGAVEFGKDIKKADAVQGQFQTPEQTEKYLDAIDNTIETLTELGYDERDVKGLTKLRNAIELSASRNQGTAIVYVFDDAIKHEKFHQIGYLSAGEYNKTLTNRIKDFKDFVKTNETVLQKSFDNFFSQYDYDARKDLDQIVEETATYIATGDYAKLGLSSTEASEYLLNWFDAYEQQNGENSLKDFEVFVKGMEIAENAIKELKDARQKEKETEINDSGQKSEQKTAPRDADKEDGGTSGKDGEDRRLSARSEELERRKNFGQLLADSQAKELETVEKAKKRSQTPVSLREKGEIPIEDRFYTGITNAERQNFADQKLDEGEATARDWFDRQVEDQDLQSGTTTAVGLSLMMHYGAKGDLASMNKVADDLVPMVTEAAQAVQAMSMVGMFNPNTAGAYAAKVYKQKTGKDLPQKDYDKAIEIARRSADAVRNEGNLQAINELLNEQNEQLGREIAELEKALKLSTKSKVEYKVDLKNAEKEIANLQKKLEGQKQERAKPTAKIIKEIKARKDEILARLQQKYGGGVLEMVAGSGDRQILKMVADKPFSPEEYQDLLDWATLTLADGMETGMTPETFFDKIKTLTNGKISIEELSDIHADAIKLLRGEKKGIDITRKEQTANRLRHYRMADQRLSREEREAQKVAKHIFTAQTNKVAENILISGAGQDLAADVILTALARQNKTPLEILEGLHQKGYSKAESRKILTDAIQLWHQAREAINRELLVKREGKESNDADLNLVAQEKKWIQGEAQRISREANKFYGGLSKPLWQHRLEAAVNFGKATLLLAPTTHLINITSNIGEQIFEVPVGIVSGTVDAITSLKTKRRSTVTIDGKALLKGIEALVRQDEALAKSDVKSGGRAFANIMKYGDSEDNLAKLQMSESQLSAINNSLFNRFVDNYINYSFRLLGGEDALFKAYAFRKVLEELASVEAKNKGLTKQEILLNPSATMIIQAHDYAEEVTFQRSNALSETISSGKQLAERKFGAGGTIAKAVFETYVPFDRTPTNIVLSTLDYSPLGFGRAAVDFFRMIKPDWFKRKREKFEAKYYGAVRQDAARDEKFLEMPPKLQRIKVKKDLDELFSQLNQRQFARRFGKATVGTGMFALGYQLAVAGLLAGVLGYDDDDREESTEFFARKEAGVEPRSLDLGTFRATVPQTPALKTLTAGATMYDYLRLAQAQKKDALGATFDAGKEVMWDLFLEQPLMKTTKDMFESNLSFGSMAGNLLVPRYVPFGRMVDMLGEVTDEKARKRSGYSKSQQKGKTFAEIQWNGFKNTTASKLPFLREYVEEPKTKVSQEERGSWVRRFIRGFDPFNIRSDVGYTSPLETKFAEREQIESLVKEARRTLPKAEKDKPLSDADKERIKDFDKKLSEMQASKILSPEARREINQRRVLGDAVYNINSSSSPAKTVEAFEQVMTSPDATEKEKNAVKGALRAKFYRADSDESKKAYKESAEKFGITLGEVKKFEK